MNNKHDWKGIEIEEYEPDDKVINIWEVSPHPSPKYDYLWIRDWYDMLDLMTDSLPYLIEGVPEEFLLESKYKITFQLKKITVKEWKLFLKENEN